MTSSPPVCLGSSIHQGGASEVGRRVPRLLSRGACKGAVCELAQMHAEGEGVRLHVCVQRGRM